MDGRLGHVRVQSKLPGAKLFVIGGGSPTTLATGDWACSDLAVDATSVYWHGLFGTDLLKVPIGGGQPTTLASSLSPGSEENNEMLGLIAVDATSVYWAGEDGAVSVGLNGGTPTTLTTTVARSLAVDATSVYIASDGISQVPLGGGLFGQVVTLVPPSSGDIYGIAVHGPQLYWTDPEGDAGGGVVMTVPVTGARLSRLLPGRARPTASRWTARTFTGPTRSRPAP